MAYEKKIWQNDSAPYINNDNLNHIEQGIYDNDTAITNTKNEINNVTGYDEYDSTQTYNVGDYCIYNNKLYVCNTAIATAEEFNSQHWTETSINGIIESVKSDVATNTSKIETITTGTGTINTSYVGSAEYNHWERVGNIVTYAFTITTTGTWSTTTAFVSGLPKPKAAIRFTAINHSYTQPFRAQLNTNGTLQNAYSTTTPASRKTN